MTYGLQVDFINNVLLNNFTNAELYVGLGLNPSGAQENLDEFIEPTAIAGDDCGYTRARVVFGEPTNGIVSNENEITFPTAVLDWTNGSNLISMLGIFTANTAGEGEPSNSMLLCVLPLVPTETVTKGETVVLNPKAIKLQLSNYTINS